MILKQSYTYIQSTYFQAVSQYWRQSIACKPFFQGEKGSKGEVGPAGLPGDPVCFILSTSPMALLLGYSIL